MVKQHGNDFLCCFSFSSNIRQRFHSELYFRRTSDFTKRKTVSHCISSGKTVYNVSWHESKIIFQPECWWSHSKAEKASILPPADRKQSIDSVRVYVVRRITWDCMTVLGWSSTLASRVMSQMIRIHVNVHRIFSREWKWLKTTCWYI